MNKVRIIAVFQRLVKYFENSCKTSNEVVYEAGYSDTKAFREVFRKIAGISPLEYKARYHYR